LVFHQQQNEPTDKGAMRMKKQLGGILRLTRYREYLWFVIITTVLGAAVGRGTFGWRLIGVLVANWLAVGFAFMINDVEDAPDDALDPAKVNRNPVSCGDLSARLGTVASLVVATGAALLYAVLGVWPLVVGATCLILGYVYSWRCIRLKSVPVADLVSHGLMLAGLQFLAAYFTFGPGPAWRWIFPLTFIVAISLYGQLFNELRDFEGDVRAGVTHTASLLGRRVAHILMMTLLAIGVGSGAVTIFVLGLIPTWVLVMAMVLAAILLVRPLFKLRRHHSAVELQQPLQKPLEIGAAVAFAIWFVGPWVDSLLGIAPMAHKWMSLIVR
jgi:4-hydroxybenzoate polyprenyltransferase